MVRAGAGHKVFADDANDRLLHEISSFERSTRGPSCNELYNRYGDLAIF